MWQLETDISYGKSDIDNKIGKTLVLTAKRLCGQIRITLILRPPQALLNAPDNNLYLDAAKAARAFEQQRLAAGESLVFGLPNRLFRDFDFAPDMFVISNQSQLVNCHFHFQKEERLAQVEHVQLINHITELVDYLAAPKPVWYTGNIAAEFERG